ncbi:hypothetical protein H1V43_34285 [Streptomyces sp. PSKA54]|uniref:Secreted protein n=1 Tax=Streptomyces himalayensis subsp. aureolus TaxID=2758039 RepID=A0A7W2D7Q0_9ACTN|nr:hypothetical protein [Streptomyces himalayensis]MBA4866301.1 hypothetical protein [Streptomyces himalayensis subsp. aureolus]
MASIRTARVIAAVVALPLSAALFTGVASAGNDPLADDGSNAAAAAVGAGGVGGDNYGTSSTTQQQAVGFGALNQGPTAHVNGSEDTAIDQSSETVLIYFADMS